jgi:molybdenum cofactor cytidylyltransferase
MNTSPFDSPGFGVVILAAGASRRMGSPKALLPWQGRTILEHLVETWKEAGARQVAVVFDPENGAIAMELDRLNISDRIPNPNAADGMMSSAKAAGAWPGWDDGLMHVAISLIDQPQIPLELMKRLAVFSNQRPLSICQPEQAGKRGHPVFFPWLISANLGTPWTPACGISSTSGLHGGNPCSVTMHAFMPISTRRRIFKKRRLVFRFKSSGNQSTYGARRSRLRIPSASASLMNASFAGSNCSLRPSFHEMAAAWQATWP